MLYASIALFAIAALLGLRVITALVQKKETPKPIVYAHGLMAATGLLLLIIYSVQHPERFPKISLIIFAIAAVGGFYLFFRDINKKPGPVGVAVIHALAAVIAFVMLLLFALA